NPQRLAMHLLRQQRGQRVEPIASLPIAASYDPAEDRPCGSQISFPVALVALLQEAAQRQFTNPAAPEPRAYRGMACKEELLCEEGLHRGPQGVPCGLLAGIMVVERKHFRHEDDRMKAG